MSGHAVAPLRRGAPQHSHGAAQADGASAWESRADRPAVDRVQSAASATSCVWSGLVRCEENDVHVVTPPLMCRRIMQTLPLLKHTTITSSLTSMLSGVQAALLARTLRLQLSVGVLQKGIPITLDKSVYCLSRRAFLEVSRPDLRLHARSLSRAAIACCPAACIELADSAASLVRQTEFTACTALLREEQ